MDRVDFLISKLEDNNTSWGDWDLYDAELFQMAEEGNQKAIEYYSVFQTSGGSTDFDRLKIILDI